jgi:hypothetical protein
MAIMDDDPFLGPSSRLVAQSSRCHDGDGLSELAGELNGPAIEQVHQPLLQAGAGLGAPGG